LIRKNKLNDSPANKITFKSVNNNNQIFIQFAPVHRLQS
jgi:hypothetical protein